MKFRLQAIEAWRGCDSDEYEFPCDSWDINAWYDCGEIELPDNSERKDLYMMLIDLGYLTRDDIEAVYTDNLECDKVILRICSLLDQQPLYELTEISA